MSIQRRARQGGAMTGGRQVGRRHPRWLLLKATSQSAAGFESRQQLTLALGGGGRRNLDNPADTAPPRLDRIQGDDFLGAYRAESSLPGFARESDNTRRCRTKPAQSQRRQRGRTRP